MGLLVFIGSGAVGKMTVGQELMKITDFRLFHNHHMIESVIEIFGKFDGAVVNKLREESCFYISPLFILPKYQNQGIGYVAIQKAFAMHPDIKVWKLDTILQETANYHLYEKCGFLRVGDEHIINDKMTLIEYEKR